MANLKEIRIRISSVSSTMQITSAMKMVSAAKLKRATDAIIRMRPYAEKLQEILSNVSSSLDSSDGKYSQTREVKNILIVVITSNRGLCGGFNNYVLKKAKKVAAEHKGANVSILALGKKASDSLSRDSRRYTDGFGEKPYEALSELTFENSSKIASEIMDQFSDGKFDKVVVCYNKFKNAGVQILMAEQFLPVLPAEDDGSTMNNDYIFEPNKEFIIEELIPKSLKIQLFKALLDSQAAEHGARMTAMHKATENAGELRDDLKLHYNKARQAAITAEILEIVGGAEALKS